MPAWTPLEVVQVRNEAVNWVAQDDDDLCFGGSGRQMFDTVWVRQIGGRKLTTDRAWRAGEGKSVQFNLRWSHPSVLKVLKVV